MADVKSWFDGTNGGTVDKNAVPPVTLLDSVAATLAHPEVSRANTDALVKIISALGDVSAALIQLEVEFRQERLRRARLENSKLEVEIDGLRSKCVGHSGSTNNRVAATAPR
jgi:hypothetical protein